jgi:periplasmic protein TonB
MDQRKSWRWVIVGYGGVVALILMVTIFIVRNASHGSVVLSNGASTPTPTVADVFHGIRPDAASPWVHARVTKVAEASPTPAPSPSVSASPAPAASPKSKTEVAVAKHPASAPKHKAAKPTTLAVADGVPPSTSSGQAFAPPAPIERAAAPTAAPVVPTAAPAVATAAPVAVAPPAAEADGPVYAPERIVDAQVRVAVQPDFPETERERGAHGTSVVLVTIDPKGNVVKTAVGSSSGFPGLDRAAVAAARESQFVAPRINGHPATETYRVVYDFSQ